MTNQYTVPDIAEDPTRLKGLPIAALAELTEKAKAWKATGDTVAKAVTAEIEWRYAAKIGNAFRQSDKDTGTVHITDEGFDLEVNRPKKVDWDQAALATIAAKIEAEGDNPAEYLKTTYAVEERAYIAWPSSIRAVFEPARTVKPGSMTIKLAPAKSEAA